MSFTRSTTNVDVHKNMPDYPSSEGYTAAQLKTAFDSSAVGLKADLNGLMTELEDATSAGNLGADDIYEGDTSDGNVQAKLEHIQSELQNVALGDIPDNTITQTKMNSTYEGTIAKKDGTLQTNLSAEMLNGKTEAQLKTAFLTTSNPTTLTFTKLAAGGGTATETQTVSTNGSRYYVLIMGSNYSYYKFALYDAKTNKFVYIANISNNTSNCRQDAMVTNFFTYNYGNGRNAKLTASYSSNVLTLNVTKTAGNSVEIPSGTITVYELGGIA